MCAVVATFSPLAPGCSTLPSAGCCTHDGTNVSRTTYDGHGRRCPLWYSTWRRLLPTCDATDGAATSSSTAPGLQQQHVTMHTHCPQLTYPLPLHAQSPTSSRSSYTSESEWSTASDSSEERERQRSRRRRRRARKHRSKSKRDRSDGGASHHSGAASRKASSSVQGAPPQPHGDMSDVGASTARGCARAT